MERLEDCLSFLIGKAQQQVTKASREALAPYGVTPVQFAILKVLWERDGLNGAELCARLVLDSATVTGLIDRMEAGGWLERRADPGGDRRMSRVYLTNKGAQLEAPLDAVMDRVNKQFVNALGRDRAASLWRDLETIGGVSREPKAARRSPASSRFG
ncbi:MarR family transcriptional regulator [Bradyrhizobium sp. ARR65]|uniref:MarR family winged helix-turn-helix transcriptional regulator n=1 Tax=Bradyrhizobium sp. ARR65 TaxID=1040989 RepID=UPI0004646C4B|nr:MarR family transcriptional regulator [Bradyrhizobium sp. ARR65]